MKLTKAQKALLEDMPTSCNKDYAPAKKLIELGLVRVVYESFGRVDLVKA